MMSTMSDANGKRRSTASRNDGGVLVNLPSTRPQRSSPRRVAARKSAQAARADRRAPDRAEAIRDRPAADRVGAVRRPREPSPSAGRPQTGSHTRREAAPRQGFESESETMTGSLRPPGGLELAASAAELVGELAKVGLSRGERLIKDALSRLPHA